MMADGPHDDQLLAALDAAIEAAQPMPATVVELGRAAWDARALDAEFAALVADSLLDEARPGGRPLAVRAGMQQRLLSFAAGDDAIELEVERGADGTQHVVGQLVPAGPAEVTLERLTGAQHARADDHGRFAFAHIAQGPARLWVRRALDGPLASAWFRL